MLHALNDVPTKTVGGAAPTLGAARLPLNYASWGPGAATLHRTSDMALRIGSDGAHLVAFGGVGRLDARRAPDRHVQDAAAGGRGTPRLF